MCFEDKYTTINNHLHTEQDDRFETFGSDLEYVKKIHKETPKRVWTVVDGDDGELHAIAGLHYVNRINYLITDEEWKDSEEEYMY
jgi:hypothetical protein